MSDVVFECILDFVFGLFYFVFGFDFDAVSEFVYLLMPKNDSTTHNAIVNH